MRKALVIDVNTDIPQPMIKIYETRIPGVELTDPINQIAQMNVLCEALIALIHACENNGMKPSHESVEMCVNRITEGFSDAQYKAGTVKID